MNAGPVILDSRGRLAARVAVAENWYDGAFNSPSRSLIHAPVQSARRDLDRYTRQQLMRKARHLYKNSPLIRGLIERLVTLTVGGGFHPVFKSSNLDWNRRAKQTWRRKARSVHLGARCSFLQYQRSVARARFLDGECFTLKTSDDEISFESLLQGLEAHQICGTEKNRAPSENEVGFGNVDGFNLNRQGAVVSYNIAGVSDPYAAEFIVQHFTPSRLGQYRGETILASAINTAIDIDEILILEKQCVKDASARKDIIKTATGELDAEAFRNVRFGDGGQLFDGQSSEQAKDDYYKQRLGAESVVLNRGDEYTPYKPDRPGSAWQGFMAFLSNTVCISAMIPPSVLLPVDIGGTDVRRDLDIAQRVVEVWQVDMAAEFDELIEYLLLPEIQDGELRAGLPDDWQQRSWYFPQKINVDRAVARQDREDVAAALMSREEYHSRWGDDSVEVDATIMEEAKRRKQQIADAGFKDVTEFYQLMSLDVKAAAQPQQNLSTEGTK